MRYGRRYLSRQHHSAECSGICPLAAGGEQALSVPHKRQRPFAQGAAAEILKEDPMLENKKYDILNREVVKTFNKVGDVLN